MVEDPEFGIVNTQGFLFSSLLDIILDWAGKKKIDFAKRTD